MFSTNALKINLRLSLTSIAFSQAKDIDKTIKVIKVEEINPPMTTVAKGRPCRAGEFKKNATTHGFELRHFITGAFTWINLPSTWFLRFSLIL